MFVYKLKMINLSLYLTLSFSLFPIFFISCIFYILLSSFSPSSSMFSFLPSILCFFSLLTFPVSSIFLFTLIRYPTSLSFTLTIPTNIILVIIIFFFHFHSYHYFPSSSLLFLSFIHYFIGPITHPLSAPSLSFPSPSPSFFVLPCVVSRHCLTPLSLFISTLYLSFSTFFFTCLL